MTQEIYKVTTEGDCEGRSVRTIGIFVGTKEQIATYLVENNIQPYYYFSFYLIDIKDVSNIKSKVKVEDDGYNRVKIIYTDDLTEKEIINNNKRYKALNKLSKEEREILGLN